jgi:ribose 5-phosphate isomerase A
MSIELKKQVAEAVFSRLNPNDIIGLGAGTTVNCLADIMLEKQFQCQQLAIACPVLIERFKAAHYEVVSLNQLRHIDHYIDGADEITDSRCCLKGGGGQQTMEKLLASMANQFWVMVDESKWSNRLGKHVPVAIEVLPEARSYVARMCIKLGGQPVYREGFKTVHNNDIIDVYDLPLAEPIALEEKLNNIIGVVGHGVFAIHRPDQVWISMATGIRHLKA